MLDTLTLARELKDAGIESKQADAITHVVQQAIEHADPAARADLDTHRAEVRADIAALEARRIKWMIGYRSHGDRDRRRGGNRVRRRLPADAGVTERSSGLGGGRARLDGGPTRATGEEVS